jgi:predicted ribosome quality control (RQC) complex YloA/Tae2 family protein
MELHRHLAGGYLFEIHSQQKNEITIAFVTPDGCHLQLVVTVRSPWFSFCTQEGLNRKRRNSAGIMPGVYERQITAVSIPPGDRQILFSLDDGHALVLRMFSAETNLLLVRNGCIVDAFKDGRKLENRPFSMTSASEPVFRTLETLAGSPALFQQNIDNAGENLSTEARLLSMLPGFDRKLVRKLMTHAENDSPEALHAVFVPLFYDLASPSPCVVEPPGQAPFFSLFEPVDSSTTTPFDTVLDALNHYSRRMYRYLHVQEQAVVLKQALTERIGKIEKELASGEKENTDEKARQYEKLGHLLTGAIGLARPEGSSVTVPNLFESEMPDLTIALRPGLNIQENAAWYFTQALKTRKKTEGTRIRHDALRKELFTLRQKRGELNSATTIEEIRNIVDSGKSKKNKTAGKNADGKEKKTPPFRTIPLTGNITLYIGRNSANNEQLTFGFARPEDIWLHARGASGSHCLLRGATMQNTSEIRRAAGMAAWYSSAKHSELVPVICTQKKYLKKDRKNPGNVIIERENVIMVKPVKEQY